MAIINLEEERQKRDGFISKLIVDDQVVYKIKGCGNKYFNAYCLKYVVSDVETTKGKVKETEDVLIAFRNSNGYEKVNSTLSAALNWKWGNNSSGSKYTRGQYIINYLNWTLRHRSYYKAYKSLADLNIQMARDYIFLLSFETERETHTYIKSTLQGFYEVLVRHNMLKYVSAEAVIGDIFEKTKLAPKRIKEINHKLPIVLIPKLIKVSEAETPDITLALMFGILAGLRGSELMNLNRNSIRILGQNDFKLVVKNRNLRSDVSSPRTRGRVKKPRTQRVYNDKLGSFLFGVNKLKEVYEDHLKLYKAEEGSEALFIDNTGKAMTSATYSNRFNLLRKKFIEYLEKSSDPVMYVYANTLKQKKWKTHLLRGIFSNVYAEYSKSVKELRAARGDEQDESALRYIADTDRITKQQEEAVQESRRVNYSKKPLSILEIKPSIRGEE